MKMLCSVYLTISSTQSHGLSFSGSGVQKAADGLAGFSFVGDVIARASDEGSHW